MCSYVACGPPYAHLGPGATAILSLQTSDNHMFSFIELATVLPVKYLTLVHLLLLGVVIRPLVISDCYRDHCFSLLLALLQFHTCKYTYVCSDTVLRR